MRKLKHSYSSSYVRKKRVYVYCRNIHLHLSVKGSKISWNVIQRYERYGREYVAVYN